MHSSSSSTAARLRRARLPTFPYTNVDPASLSAGDIVIVRPGEVIPVDGIVRAGHASIDQAPITGESHHEDVGPGAEVFAGTLNLDGLLRIEVQGAGSGTVLGRVVRILQDVEQAKTPIVRLLERVAGAYLPVVLAVACISLFWTGELDRFITVLIVACPCALVLAAPSAMVAAMATSTRLSILIKNAAFLEEVATVDTLILPRDPRWGPPPPARPRLFDGRGVDGSRWTGHHTAGPGGG